MVFWQVIAALTPTVCVALLFWVAMRAIVNADRRERVAVARFEAENDVTVKTEVAHKES